MNFHINYKCNELTCFDSDRFVYGYLNKVPQINRDDHCRVLKVIRRDNSGILKEFEHLNLEPNNSYFN